MSSAHLAWLSTGSTLSTTVVIFPAYGHLRHHDSEIMDGGGIGRGDAGAVGVVVAQRQGADQALVPAGPHGRLGRAVPRRPARAGAAQDRMDASGSRRGSGALAPAGAPRSEPVGCRCVARSRARL